MNRLGLTGRYETFVNVTGNLFVVALEITNVAMEDAGKYRVTCKNEFGESNANIGLNFDGKFFVFCLFKVIVYGKHKVFFY